MTRDADPRLSAYGDLVRSWAPRMNLVSAEDLDRFEDRHIEDSLRLQPLLDTVPKGPCCDVGSGAGLPGIPLAIVSQRRWRLLEPRRRRAAFLEEVVRTLELDAEVIIATAEQAGADERLAGGHALVVSRALAQPEQAFKLMLPLVAPGGVAAAFVGQKPIPDGAEEWAPGIATMRVPTA